MGEELGKEEEDEEEEEQCRMVGDGGGGSIDGIVWSLFKRLSVAAVRWGRGGEGVRRPDKRDTVSAVNY